MTRILNDIYLDTNSTQLILRNSTLRLEFSLKGGFLEAVKVPGMDYRLPMVRTAVVKINDEWLPAGADALERFEYGVDATARSAYLRLVFKLTSDYELTETYTLYPEQMSFTRSARLIRLAGDGAVHLEEFRFTLPAVTIGELADCVFDTIGPFPSYDTYTNPIMFKPGGWLYITPRTPLSQLIDHKHTLGSAPDLGLGILAVSNPAAGLCLATWMETGGEVNYQLEIAGENRGVTMIFDDMRAARLLPGMAVESDIQHIVIAPRLPEALAQYRTMAERTMPLAGDAPEWIAEMVILEAMPDGFAGGFTGLEAKLPFYRDLGINTLYLMPHWLGGYSNIDMYAVDARLGTPKELKALTAKAHELGMRVLFDSVIHGFDPDSAVVKKHPELFIKTEDGKLAQHPVWKTVSTDWASPAYQNYMADLARHHVEEFNIDGYRLDAASYKGAGWDPDLPYPAYRPGSAAEDLMRAMVNAMRETKPEAVILNEVFGPAFYKICDLEHDNMTMGPMMFLERLQAGEASAESYKDHLANVRDCLPVGAQRVYFARNHDTSWFYHFNGYTKRFLALDAIHAFFGIPEFFSGDPKYGPNPDDDPQVYDFYRQVWKVRRVCPEMTRGSILLREVSCNNRMVFTGARAFGERLSVVAVSLSEESEEATIALDLNIPPTAMHAFDAVTGAAVVCSLNGSTLELVLAPCQVVVIRWG